jgi:hypothetical protein
MDPNRTPVYATGTASDPFLLRQLERQQRPGGRQPVQRRVQPRPDRAPGHVVYCAGVDVEVFALERASAST